MNGGLSVLDEVTPAQGWRQGWNGRRAALLSLLIAAFGWRLNNITSQSFWRDEVDVVYLAVRPLGDILSMFISPAQNGPLYMLAIRLWIFLTGSSEFALRLSAALAGTLAVLLTWQVARRLLPGEWRPGLGNLPMLAAILLAVNPYQLWYSQEGKMYTVVVCMTLLSMWAWLDAMRLGGGRRWLTYLVITSLCIYTHLLTVLILPLHFAWFLLSWPLNRTRWRGYLAACLGFVLPYLPLIWWQWHYLNLEGYETGYPFVPFPEILRSLLLGFSRGAGRTPPEVWLIPLFFVLLAGGLLGLTEMGRGQQSAQPGTERLLPVPRIQRTALLLSWLILPVLLIYGMSLVQPIFVDRYLIWISPAFVMVMALGLQVIRRSGGLWSAGLAGLLLIYVVGLWLWTGQTQAQIPNKTQLREAVHYVAERREAGELLILQIPHTEYAYRYYTSDFGPNPFAGSDERLDPWMGGLWTRNGLDDPTAAQEVNLLMRANLGGSASAWLILVEAGMWDPRGLMLRWLDENGEVRESRQFHGIEARRYEFR